VLQHAQAGEKFLEAFQNRIDAGLGFDFMPDISDEVRPIAHELTMALALLVFESPMAERRQQAARCDVDGAIRALAEFIVPLRPYRAITRDTPHDVTYH